MSNPASPKVTTIIATYNDGGTIETALESLANQTYPNHEVVGVDGGSDDETAEIFARYPALVHHFDSRPDEGIYDAWNRALDRVRGDWVLFIGADDYLWDEEVFEDVAPHLERARGEGVRLAYGKRAIVHSSRDTVMRREGGPWDEELLHTAVGCPLPHSSTFHHRELFEEHGSFDPWFKISGDMEYLYRELKKRPAYFIPDRTLVAMRYGGTSTSLSPWAVLRRFREGLEARRRHDLLSLRGGLSLVRFLMQDLVRSGLKTGLGPRRFYKFSDQVRKLVRKDPYWTPFY